MSQTPVSSRSWRKRAAAETSKGARTAQIILMFLIVGALIALFVYMMLPPTRTKPYVNVAYVEQYGLTDFPAPLYVQRDVEAIQQLFESNSDSDDPGVHSFDSKPIASNQEFRDLLPSIRDQIKEMVDRDVVMIYVSALGVSDQDNGYLLASDSKLNKADTWCSINEFLSIAKDTEEIKAKTKVILLETGQIDSDVFAGITVNGFPYYLHKAVSEIDDKNLWVICSNSVMQISNLSHARKRSVFGWAVSQAFLELGGQDSNADEEITLGAFYKSVLDHCGTYARIGDSPVQTPLLMRGGTGFIDKNTWSELDLEIKETVLFYRDQIKAQIDESDNDEDESQANHLPARQKHRWHSSQTGFAATANLLTVKELISAALNKSEHPVSSTKQQQDENGNQEESKKDGQKQDNTAENNDDASTESKVDQDQQPQSKPKDFDAKKYYEDHPNYTPLTDIQKKMMRIWLLRDWLQSRPKEFDYLSPVDFAPNSWHEFNLELIALDQLIRAQGEQLDSQWKNKIELIEKGLNTLVSDMQGNTGGSSSHFIISNIIKAWSANQNEPDFMGPSLNNDDRLKAIQMQEYLSIYRDVTFRARYYAMWCPGRPLAQIDTSTPINDLFNQLAIARKLFEDESNYEILDSTIETMETAAQRLLKAEADSFESLIKSYEFARQRNTGQFEAEYWISRLLDSPLICVEYPAYENSNVNSNTTLDRFGLLNQMSQIADSKSNFFSNEQEWPTLTPQNRDQIAIKNKLAVMSQVLKLDDVNAFERVGQAMLSAGYGRDAAAQLNSFKNVDTVWNSKVKEIVSAAGNTSKDWAPRYKRWRLMSLLDPRVASEFSNRFAAPATEFKRAKVMDSFVFDRNCRDPINLDITNKKRISMKVESDSREIKITSVEFDERLFQVRYRDKDLESGEDFDLGISEKAASFELEIYPRPGIDRKHRPASLEQGPSLIKIEAKLGNEQLDTSFAVELPLPNQIDVEVRQLNWKRKSEKIAKTDENNNILSLNCFPNTESFFEFELHNQSGKKKTVIAEYWLVQLTPEMVRNQSLRPMIGTFFGEQGRLSEKIADQMNRILNDSNNDKTYLLASSAKTDIPPESSRPLSFKKTDPAKSDEGGNPDSGTTESKPKEPIARQSNYGMVIRLVEINGDEEKPRPELVWLELRRVVASQLVSANAKFTKETGELVISINANEEYLLLNRGLKEIVCKVQIEDDDVQAEFEEVKLTELDGGLAQALKVNLPNYKSASGKRQIAVSVMNVPRAFVFEVDLGKDTDFGSDDVIDVRPGMTEVSIGKITGLDEEGKETDSKDFKNIWATKSADKLDVEMHVDLPIEQPVGDISFKLMAGTPIIRRQKTDRLVAYNSIIKDEQFLVINSSVTDHREYFSPGVGDNSTRLELIAEVKSRGEKIQTGTDSRFLVFDNNYPTAKFQFANKMQVKSADNQEKVTVKLELDDQNGIGIDDTTVKIGIDIEQTGEIDKVKFKDEEPNKSTSEDGKVIFNFTFNVTEKLKPGETYKIFAIAADKNGNVNDVIEPLKLTINKPAKTNNNQQGNGGGGDNNNDNSMQNKQPELFEIKLDVKFGTRPLSGDAKATVYIKGPKTLSGAANANKSSVNFKDLPAGEYKVTAKGTASNGYAIEAEETNDCCRTRQQTIPTGNFETKIVLKLTVAIYN